LPISNDAFVDILDRFSQAYGEMDAVQIADLFAEDAIWKTHPHDPNLSFFGRAAIIEMLNTIEFAKADEVSFNYVEDTIIVDPRRHVGYVEWLATKTRNGDIRRTSHSVFTKFKNRKIIVMRGYSMILEKGWTTSSSVEELYERNRTTNVTTNEKNITTQRTEESESSKSKPSSATTDSKSRSRNGFMSSSNGYMDHSSKSQNGDVDHSKSKSQNGDVDHSKSKSQNGDVDHSKPKRDNGRGDHSKSKSSSENGNHSKSKSSSENGHEKRKGSDKKFHHHHRNGQRRHFHYLTDDEQGGPRKNKKRRKNGGKNKKVVSINDKPNIEEQRAKPVAKVVPEDHIDKNRTSPSTEKQRPQKRNNRKKNRPQNEGKGLNNRNEAYKHGRRRRRRGRNKKKKKFYPWVCSICSCTNPPNVRYCKNCNKRFKLKVDTLVKKEKEEEETMTNVTTHEQTTSVQEERNTTSDPKIESTDVKNQETKI